MRLPAAAPGTGAGEGPLASWPREQLAFPVGGPFLALALGHPFSQRPVELAIPTEPRVGLGGKEPPPGDNSSVEEKLGLVQRLGPVV